jgi:hypothetical protein
MALLDGMKPLAFFTNGFKNPTISSRVALSRSGENFFRALRSSLAPFSSVGIALLLCSIFQRFQ